MTEKRKCNFCGHDEDAVNFLISGPLVFICGQCVHLCVDILYQGTMDKLRKLRNRQSEIQNLDDQLAAEEKDRKPDER